MKSKIAIVGMLALATLTLEAQNASYRLNNGGVSGVNNSAYGWNAINNTTSGADNSACGFRALNANTNGNRNSGIGSRALVFNTSGDDNSATGHNALYSNTSGSYNTAMGSGALFLNTTGTYNTAIGYNADMGSSGLINATAIGANAVVNTSYAIQLGDGNVTQIFGGVNNNATFIVGGLQVTGGAPALGKVLTSDAAGVATWQSITASGLGAWSTSGNAGTVDGTNFIGTTDNVPLNFMVNNQKAGRIDHQFHNVFFGNYSGNSANVFGGYNTGFGSYSLWSATSGHYNSAFGYLSMKFTTTGHDNTASGPQSLMNNTLGSWNTAIGSIALQNNTSGNYNTSLGNNSLNGNLTGDYNTVVGAGANVGAGNLINATAIGANAFVTTSDAIQLGDAAVSQVFVGTANTGTLISGGLQITGGAPAVGKVLTSDAVGNAIWQTPLGGGGSAWSLTGDAGTVDGTNFIGTTDNVPFNIKVNGQKAGRIDHNAFNTFYGYKTGNSTTTGWYNTAIGFEALNSSINGGGNTANGYRALYQNLADGNTASGQHALTGNTLGNANTAIGSGALIANTTGNFNTAVGERSLWFYSNGSNNSAFGHFADVAANNLTNATAIGNGAIAMNSNNLRLGNTTCTLISGNPSVYTGSDARFKTNIEENDVVGLEFIKRLRPVVYNFDTKKQTEHITKNMPDSVRKVYLDEDFAPSTAIRQSGFIAQEVEKAAQEAGYNFHGVHKPDNDNDYYSLAYSTFVVPLVKAVQEQQLMITEQTQENQKLQAQMEELKALVNALAGNTTVENKTSNIKNTSVELSDKNAVVLNQNVPNPFAESTVISYTIPTDFTKAQILFTTNEGKVIRVIDITEKGSGNLNVFANDLTNGVYTYTLVIDGKTMDSKKMIKE